MSDFFFIVLRRLRAPLIVLICVYSIATFGLTQVPGVDPDGNIYYMSFFHAFYFVSFMGSTIGFGEVPHPFSDAQRLWVLICIYACVISWLYAIGTLLRLIQDKAFQQTLSEKITGRVIRNNKQPFYIICGYGETGARINRALNKLGYKVVIIDFNDEQQSLVELEELQIAPIVLVGDAREPKTLQKSGISMPNCRGLIAVTQDDHTNLNVAISSKLVNPELPVICRSEIEDEEANMASFGTDVIINPFKTFASLLNLLVKRPDLYQVHNWFINQGEYSLKSDKPLPTGRWIVCGYGRFGKAIHQLIDSEEIELVLVDANPQANNAPEGTIAGRGTEAVTLEQAGIDSASVVIAASDDDANNLSVILTARNLNKDIYTIGRVSNESNEELFLRAKCDFLMRRSKLVANSALTTISRPLVSQFLKYSESLTQEQVLKLSDDILANTYQTQPMTWRLIIDQDNAPAIFEHLKEKKNLTVAQVCEHSELKLNQSVPLLLLRNGICQLLPEPDTQLEINDQLLVCGRENQALLPQRLAQNSELIDTLINQNPHHIPLLRWLKRRTT